MLLSHAEDPRGPWEKLRRKPLERICQAEGIAVKEGEPAYIYRDLLARNGVNFQKYAYLVNGGPLHGNMSDRQENRTDGLTISQIPTETKEAKSNDFGLSLEDLTRPQLMKICKSRNVKFSPTDKAADLVRKLNEQNAA